MRTSSGLRPAASAAPAGGEASVTRSDAIATDRPIVVVGTTGDPATPIDNTRAMADALEEGVLVIVHADQHTGYGVNDCVDEAVDAYLVDPTKVPEDGLECR